MYYKKYNLTLCQIEQYIYIFLSLFIIFIPILIKNYFIGDEALLFDNEGIKNFFSDINNIKYQNIFQYTLDLFLSNTKRRGAFLFEPYTIMQNKIVHGSFFSLFWLRFFNYVIYALFWGYVYYTVNKISPRKYFNIILVLLLLANHSVVNFYVYSIIISSFLGAFLGLFAFNIIRKSNKKIDYILSFTLLFISFLISELSSTICMFLVFYSLIVWLNNSNDIINKNRLAKIITFLVLLFIASVLFFIYHKYSISNSNLIYRRFIALTDYLNYLYKLPYLFDIFGFPQGVMIGNQKNSFKLILLGILYLIPITAFLIKSLKRCDSQKTLVFLGLFGFILLYSLSVVLIDLPGNLADGVIGRQYLYISFQLLLITILTFSIFDLLNIEKSKTKKLFTNIFVLLNIILIAFNTNKLITPYSDMLTYFRLQVPSADSNDSLLKVASYGRVKNIKCLEPCYGSWAKANNGYTNAEASGDAIIHFVSKERGYKSYIHYFYKTKQNFSNNTPFIPGYVNKSDRVKRNRDIDKYNKSFDIVIDWEKVHISN